MPGEHKEEKVASEDGAANGKSGGPTPKEGGDGSAPISIQATPDPSAVAFGGRLSALSAANMAAIAGGLPSACSSPGTPGGAGESAGNGGSSVAKKGGLLGSPKGYKRKGQSFGDEDDDDEEETSWNRAQRTAEKLAQVLPFCPTCPPPPYAPPRKEGPKHTFHMTSGPALARSGRGLKRTRRGGGRSRPP